MYEKKRLENFVVVVVEKPTTTVTTLTHEQLEREIEKKNECRTNLCV